MFKKIFYCFLVLIFGVLGIYLVFIWQIQRSMKSLPVAFQELQKLPREELQNKFFGEATEYKEFITPDGNLKIRYLADWIEGGKETIESFGLGEERMKGEMIFYGQKFKMTGLAFLFIQKFRLEEGENFEELIEKIKNDIKGIEVVNLDLEKGIFEAKYKREEFLELHSLEKFLSKEKEGYLVSFLTFEQIWGTFEKEAREIIESCQILEK